MLPYELSNGICSLNGGVVRLALLCFMEVDRDGNMVDHYLAETVIHSNKSMTYDNVDKVILGEEVPEGYEPFVFTLNSANKFAKLLRKNRMAKGATDFDTCELQFKLDENDKPCEIIQEYSTDATEMIEEFMLIANKTVAKDLYDKGLPCVYRVHGQPNYRHMTQFFDLLNSYGYDTSGLTPSECCEDPMKLHELSEYIKCTESLYPILADLLIRCQDKAGYSPSRDGHYGLNEQYYCHFTSPIRRYPDLQVHRIVKASLLKDEKKKNELLSKYKDENGEVALQSSKGEIKADQFDRYIQKIQCEEFMRRSRGEKFEATVVDITTSNMELAFDNNVHKSLSVENLPGKYVYSYNSKSLYSATGCDAYHLGDRLGVQIGKPRGDYDYDIKLLGKISEIQHNRNHSFEEDKAAAIANYQKKKTKSMKRSRHK